MKMHTKLFLFFLVHASTFVPAHAAIKESTRITDSIPQVCNYLPGKDIEALHPFTTLLTTSFPDPNAYETYTGCYYQFYTDSEKPQLAVRLMKWGSKQEALDEYKMQAQRHLESWGIYPERLSAGADSAYFSIDPMDSTKCDECHLVAIQGIYSVYVSFKGQPNGITREGKKLVALAILKIMYDRIPGLAPSRIRNRQ
jgi:hypothetical protein